MTNRLCQLDPQNFQVTIADAAGPIASYTGAIVEIKQDYERIEFRVVAFERQTFHTKPPADRKVQLLRAMLIATGMAATDIDEILENA